MEQVEISFEGMTPADSTRLAEDLVTFVKSDVEGVQAEVAGGSKDSMDLGATVVLILGTPALAALARGVANWIARQGDPDLVIRSKKGSVTVKRGLNPEAKKEIILAAFDKGVI
jgi:hypothetical protein